MFILLLKLYNKDQLTHSLCVVGIKWIKLAMGEEFDEHKRPKDGLEYVFNRVKFYLIIDSIVSICSVVMVNYYLHFPFSWLIGVSVIILHGLTIGLWYKCSFGCHFVDYLTNSKECCKQRFACQCNSLKLRLFRKVEITAATTIVKE